MPQVQRVTPPATGLVAQFTKQEDVMNHVLHVGSFKNVRKLDGPRQLRATYTRCKGAMPESDIHVSTFRVHENGRSHRVVKISTPYEMVFVSNANIG